MANPPVNNSIYDYDKTSRRFRCDVCNDKWPESRLVIQDGASVCLDNCWYPGGSKTERDLMRADAAMLAARLTAEHVPPIHPGASLMDGVPGVEKITPYPALLTRNGAAVAVTITGVNFTSANTTIVYGHIQIMDASAAIYTATLITLSVWAKTPIPIGDYLMTVNNQIYRNVFKVRD